MSTPTLSEYLATAKAELTRANADRRHPFRNVVVSTCRGDVPSQRMVVMRKFAADFSISIYTDRRSQKISELNDHPDGALSLLFWHPKKRLQIRMSGWSEVISETEEVERIWKNVPEVSHISYTTAHPPGAIIQSPTEVEMDEEAKDGRHFVLLRFHPVLMDVLQLNRELHLRAGYHLAEGEWEGNWLVP